MHFIQFAKSAAALLLFVLTFAAPAHAQNNKQIISGTFYEDRASINGNFATATLTFTQTPSDKFLNITHVNCTISVLSNQILAVAELGVGTTPGAADLGRPMSVRGNTTGEAAGGSKYYSVITQVYYKIGPGRYPWLSIATAASTGSFALNGACTIVGELTDS
ncbi:hypothetical protein ACWAT4_20020 [Bradyrhizobium manausense]